MQGLANVPVFFGLKGKKVVLAGGSKAALWKAELFRAAGAALEIYSADPCADLCELARGHSTLRLVRRRFAPEDLRGAALAVADAADAEDAEEFAQAFKAAAQAAGVPANIVDRPEFSDFQFGAIVDRSPLVIGISTNGGSPILAQALRGRLEAMLTHEVKLWAGAAKGWRRKLKNLDLSAKARRRFWELFSAKALAARGSGPEEADFARLLAATEADAPSAAMGSVALVGAGPGDPELLTLKALRILQSADVVLYDDLVAPGVVEMARREAEKIPVGKRGYRPSCRQEHIVELLISLAKSGRRVVRLKGGDPMIFGRANEEISALRAAGVPVEVVPGVTAALGAAAALKLSLTERDKARRLQFITAHAHDGKLPEDIDWRSICDARASSVIYMGRKTLGALSERLLAHGLDPATPAILVERATWPDERSIAGTIADLPGKLPADEFSGPCVILIGEAFAAAASEESVGASPLDRSAAAAE